MYQLHDAKAAHNICVPRAEKANRAERGLTGSEDGPLPGKKEVTRDKGSRGR